MKSLRYGALPRTKTAVVAAVSAVIAFISVAEKAQAIPTFSRKYRTACATCHTVFPKLTDVGEAFRRNGYQFPSGEELLVKDEPIPLGSDAFKDAWPDSIWPSDIPHLPPIFIRGQLRERFNTDPAAPGDEDGNDVKWQQDMPHELVLGGAGTFGPNISAFWNVEWSPSEDEVGVERMFVQFSNLFAWGDEDDEDGLREGNGLLNLPKHALNLRIGRMETNVLPRYFSVHNRPGVEPWLHASRNRDTYPNRFNFEPAQSAAVELHGIIQQYNTYAIGFSNGGSNATDQALDDNNRKDVYFRVARKWFGFPLDGELGTSEPVEEARGQSPDCAAPASTCGTTGEDDEFAPARVIDFRALGFETGFFGWFGKARLDGRDNLTPLPGFQVNGAPVMVNAGQFYGESNDYFRRVGADARLQWFDLDVYAMFIWGHDNFDAALGANPLATDAFQDEDFYLYTIGADYMVKPWMLAYARYEQLQYNEGARQADEEGRFVPGVVFLIRQNVKLQTEWVIDTTGADTGGSAATDTIFVQLDFAF